MSSIKIPFVVPFRFLTSISHIVLCGILLSHRVNLKFKIIRVYNLTKKNVKFSFKQWNLIGCGTDLLKNPTLLNIKDDQ